MASKDGTTQKWVAKFRELMDWFIGLEKVDGDNLTEAHIKGLAANYLAVKLGIFDPTKPIETLDPLDREPPYRHGDWECDHPELSGYQQIKQWRLERMPHWRRKAEEHGEFKRAVLQKEATEDNIRRYCDCLRNIDYQARANSSWTDVTPLALEANDLAVKLGLTHPDWILAMNLGLLPHFLGTDEIRQLPLPWKCDKPPVIFNGHSCVLGALSGHTAPNVEELLKKAQALVSSTTRESREDMSASQEIPPEYRSAPLSLKRMAELWGGDMTAKKLRAMIDNGRIRVEKINRQTFVFDTRDLPSYVVEDTRR